MKTFKWKRLVYAFLVLGLLGACGNSNKSGETTILDNSNIGIDTSGTIPSDLNSVDAYINAISNGQFKAAIRTDARYDYLLTTGNSKSSGFQYNYCFFGKCKNNYPPIETMTRTLSGSTVVRESVDTNLTTNLVQLKTDLANMLRSAKTKSDAVFSCRYYGTNCYYSVYGLSYGQIQFEHNNTIYLVDLNLPLAANPVAAFKLTDGQGYQFILEY